MRRTLLTSLLFLLTILPQAVSAQDYLLFPNDSAFDLTLISTNPHTHSFVIKNNNGDHAEGTLHDALGFEQGQVVAVTSSHLIIETINITQDPHGNMKEQRTRTPLYLSGILGHGKSLGSN